MSQISLTNKEYISLRNKVSELEHKLWGYKEECKEKEQLNKESIDILLEYGIITEENLEVLIKAGKVQYSVDNAEEQKGMMEELYESFAK